MKFAYALTAALLAVSAMPANAETVGNSPTERGFLDTTPNLTFVLDQAFAATPGVVTSFNFYAGSVGDVTPLLFTRSEAGGQISFTLAAIGTTRDVGAGAYSFDFGLTQGANLTGATTYFGFRTANLGVVTYDYQSDALPGAFAVQDTSAGMGATYTFGQGGSADNGYGLNYRAYSINATTAAVPEPATWAMMMFGFGGLGYAMRRKSEASARIRFA